MSDRSKKLIRIGVLLGLFTAIYVGVERTGLLEQIDVDWVREQVESAGTWGFFAYVAFFTVGVILYVPGIIFAAAGVVVYGKLLGAPLGWVATIVAMNTSFLLTRAIGGQALGGLKNKHFQKALSKLHERPVRTVAFLRLLTWWSPPLTAALALTPLRFRDHVVGTALGMLGPMLGLTLLTGWCVTAFGL